MRCETCQEEATIHIDVIGCHFCESCLKKIDERIASMNQAAEMNLNTLSQQVHAANAKWWTDLNTGERIERNKGELIALIHSEISEMTVGRKFGLKDDKLPNRYMEEVECVDAFIRALDYAGGFGYKLPDVEIGFALPPNLEALAEPCSDAVNLHEACSDLLESERKSKGDAAEKVLALILKIYKHGALSGYDLQGAFDEKMVYNATRIDHTPEHRKAEGGKKW